MSEIEFGYIGLGAMGGAMAQKIAQSVGHLTVYDVSDETRARFVAMGIPTADSLGALLDGCDVVLTCLPSPDISVEVARQIAAHRGKVCVLAEMSTVGYDTVRMMKDILSTAGITLVDSPVSGGPKAVPAGQLACFAAGKAGAVALLAPVYDALSAHYFNLGEEVGAAQALKVGNNLLAAANFAIVSEVVTMLAAAGIAPETAISAINVSTGRSRASEVVFPAQVLTGTFFQGARLEILAKDTSLALKTAHDYGREMKVGAAVCEAWAEAAADGYGEADFTNLYKWVDAKGKRDE